MGEICRKFAAGAAIAVAALLSAGPVEAAGASWVAPPSEQDVAAAVKAAETTRAISFAKSNFRQVGHADPGRITLEHKGFPVYTLNPDFVAAKPGAPAGVLRAIAVTATAATGAKATLRAAPDHAAPTGWSVGNVLSGNDEEALSARLRPGSVLLNEPQINGWYDLGRDGVVLLQASLPQSPVGQFMPIAEYQQQVHSRYADKQPGSDYQRGGGLGFAQTLQRDTGPAGSLVAGLIVLGSAVVLGGAFLGWRWRKRRISPK
ncbi:MULTISPECIES: hypothetical protein [unclassified Amycolatopsis]|uniref:hypothetical protein n=1 Tax=unclassified Amycolatopsis TaxID=2618356 RepID=UPI00106EE0ED|nr:MULTISPECIES: hypothetical protein [unclassified Amycolatopsis]